MYLVFHSMIISNSWMTALWWIDFLFYNLFAHKNFPWEGEKIGIFEIANLCLFNVSSLIYSLLKRIKM